MTRRAPEEAAARGPSEAEAKAGEGGEAAAEAPPPAAPLPAESPVPERPEGLLGLGGRDLLAMGVLLVVAFGFRFFSPLMPDFLSRPFETAPVSNCVRGTPVDAQNHTGTLCGLAYPYQRNYSAQGAPPTPPEGEVFDEIYFGVFAHDDLKGISYFDPEPPLSKEVIAAGEWLYGWWRATFEGARGSYADLGFNTFGWRLMSCLVGTLCIPLMYLLALRLWSDRTFAVAAATLACFDGMFFIQSRIGMIDIIPIFLIMLAYTAFGVHLRARSERAALLTLFLTGSLCGVAIAAKWIALAATATILFFLLTRPLLRRVGLSLGTWRWGLAERAALPGGARLLPYLGVGVAAFVAMPVLIYIASWFPFFSRGQFHSLNDLVSYQRQIFDYHAHLTATHPYGSAWFSWPFLYRPVAYYYESQGLGVDLAGGHSLVAGMVNLGNPLIWWASIPALLSLPYFVLRHRSFPAALILIGFITAYLPWSRISRVIFLYHMFGGLIFMILALAFVLVRMQRAGPVGVHLFGDRFQLTTRWLVPAYLGAVVIAFLYFYPVWTALPISDQAYLGGFGQGRMWLRTWI